MKEKPRDPNESLFAHGGGVKVILNGLLIGLLTLIAFVIGARMYTGAETLFPIFPANIPEDALRHARTMAFVVLSVSQLFHSFNMRHPEKSIFQLGFFSNKYLVGAVLIGILLQDIVITVPFLRNVFNVFDLNGKDWAIVAVLSVMPLLINEIAKLIKRTSKKA
jgi:Ca2+-transporting ATPase